MQVLIARDSVQMAMKAGRCDAMCAYGARCVGCDAGPAHRAIWVYVYVCMLKGVCHYVTTTLPNLVRDSGEMTHGHTPASERHSQARLGKQATRFLPQWDVVFLPLGFHSLPLGRPKGLY